MSGDGLPESFNNSVEPTSAPAVPRALVRHLGQMAEGVPLKGKPLAKKISVLHNDSSLKPKPSAKPGGAVDDAPLKTAAEQIAAAPTARPKLAAKVRVAVSGAVPESQPPAAKPAAVPGKPLEAAPDAAKKAAVAQSVTSEASEPVDGRDGFEADSNAQSPSEALEPSANPTGSYANEVAAGDDDSEQPSTTSNDTGDDTFNDDKTDAAVADIMRRESDALLSAQDAEHAGETVEPPHFKHHWLRRGLHSSLTRWAMFALLLAACSAVFGMASSRYWVLNHCGVRASLSVNVTDAGTLLPLAGVSVTMDGQRATTDVHGNAVLHQLRLGNEQLSLSRVAFAPQTRRVVVGWGENPLGTFTLRPTGVRYTAKAVDYFSGQPVPSATAANDTSEAAADKTGLITLTLDTNGGATATATVSAPGYRAAAVTLSPTGANSVALVPAQKDVFIAKASGTYNLYKIDADGTNEQELLAGAGSETLSGTALAVSPDNARAALVSTRDRSLKASNGSLEQELTIVDVATGAAITLDRADSLQLLGWSGNTLVYQTASTAGAAVDSTRVKIISYNFTTSTRQQLAAANDFNAAAVVQNTLYYAVSGSDPSAAADFFKVNIDNTGLQTLLSQEVIGIYRTAFATLTLQTAGGWFSYAIGGNAAPTAINAPDNYPNAPFVLSPDGQHAVAVSANGGKASLSLAVTSNGKTATLPVAQTPAYPLYWLNNTTIVFRVAGSPSADYAVGILGGPAKKITAVANVAGLAP